MPYPCKEGCACGRVACWGTIKQHSFSRDFPPPSRLEREPPKVGLGFLDGLPVGCPWPQLHQAKHRISFTVTSDPVNASGPSYVRQQTCSSTARRPFAGEATDESSLLRTHYQMINNLSSQTPRKASKPLKASQRSCKPDSCSLQVHKAQTAVPPDRIPSGT